MFKVLTSTGRTVEFSFSHDPHFETFMGKNAVKGLTTATVFVDQKPTTDVALCSAKDQWNREAGRKVALLRAMQAAGLTKAERYDVWCRYFQRNVTNKEWFGEAATAAPEAAV